METLAELKGFYCSLFDRGGGLEKVEIPNSVPPAMLPLIRHMRFCRNRAPPEPLFHNGAGKTWVLHLFNIRHELGMGSEWGLKMSTTTTTADWCSMKGDNISGRFTSLPLSLNGKKIA
jgi:hypothetical protein